MGKTTRIGYIQGAHLLSAPYLVTLAILLVALTSLSSSLSMSVIWLVCSLVIAYLSAWQQAEYRVPTLAFLAMVVLFLVGRPVIVDFFGGRWDDEGTGLPDLGVANYAQAILVRQCLTYMLAGLSIGMCLAGQVWSRKRKRILNSRSSNGAEGTIWVFFLISVVLNTISSLVVSVYIAREGYLTYHVSYNSPIPRLALYFGAAMVPFYCAVILLAEKRARFVLATMLFLLSSAVSLLTLKRGVFMTAVLLVVVVIFGFRNQRGGKPTEFQPRNVLLLSLAAIPASWFLQMFAAWRSGAGDDFRGNLIDLLFDQGTTVATIGYTIQLGEALPKRPYVFGPLAEGIQRILGTLGFDMTLMSGQTIERAESTWLLSHVLTYAVMPERYLAGRGLGSSFATELLAEFGILGVFFGSVFCGALVIVVSHYVIYGSMPVAVACLLMYKEMIWMPRSGFIDWLALFLEPNTIIGMGLIVLVSYKRLGSVREAPL